MFASSQVLRFLPCHQLPVGCRCSTLDIAQKASKVSELQDAEGILMVGFDVQKT